MIRLRWLALLSVTALCACSGGGSTVADGGIDAGHDAGPLPVSPAPSAISPASGPTDGGTAVTVTGSGFAAGAQVRVGSALLTQVVVASPAELHGVTPPLSAGTFDVVVINPDSRLGKLQGAFTAIAPAQDPSIGFCNLQFPQTANLTAGAPLSLYGRVYVQGITDGVGQGAGIEMQAGTGQPDGSAFTWTAATFNSDVPSAPGANDHANDEYVLATTVPAPGSYGTAYRARISGGAFSYCEVDGMHTTLDASRLGTLTSTAPVPPRVTFCNLQFPLVATGAPGAATSVYGQVYQPGITDSAGQGAGITMEFGYGFGDGGFTWSPTTYDGDRGPSGANDEYVWSGPNPAVGSYQTVFRATLDGGPFTYCESDGPHDQLDPTKTGSLTISPTPPPKVGWCNLQFPQQLQVDAGTAPTYYGRVYAQGVTDTAGPGPGIAMQLGLDLPDAGWLWQSATYNTDVASFPGATDINNDEYLATLPPLMIGNRSVAFRASLDGGPWTYCETDGPHATLDDAQLGALTVGPTVAYCNLQFPAQVTGPASSPVDFFGQVYQPGVTDQVGQGAGIFLELGVAPIDGGFQWQSTTFNGDRNNNDEYRATVSGLSAGSYLTAFRAALDGGPWLYCEPDGPHLRLDRADAGSLILQ
jgi:hypothetical protein